MMAQAVKPALELNSISKQFGGIRAINNVSACVNQGERFAIIGPNGAGKTTLFNMICGEFPPTSGTIRYFGKDVTGLPSNRLANLGIGRTFQITSLFNNESVLENVVLSLMGNAQRTKFKMFSSLRSQKALFEEAEHLLEGLGLIECRDEQIKNLSYGNQRLVEIAMVLAGKPQIICLDEPNAGLSNAESRTIIKTIKEIDKQITVLLIEHDMDMVFEVADRIMVLSNGTWVATDTAANIRVNKEVQRVYLGEDKENGDSVEA